MRRVFWLSCVLVGVGCHHDLAKLRGHPTAAEGGSAPMPSSHDAGGGNELATCEPCSAPAGLTELGKPAACCTGTRGAQCGVSLVSGGRCFARDVPSVPDPSCPEVVRLGTRFPGCCRLDGQCGIVVESLGLGCLGRDEVPAVLGGPLTARACTPKCDTDQVCSALADLAVCVEDATHRADARYCAVSCRNDKDCSLLPGTVCAIQANAAARRFDAVCRKAVGPGELGGNCASADDCVHGVCIGSTPPYCSQLCRTDLDCPGAGNQCKSTPIPLPAPSTGTQLFSACIQRK